MQVQHIIVFATLLLQGCMQPTDAPYLKNVAFQPERRILTVDYAGNPDTTLHQVIALSVIRKSGYGVLINVGSSASDHYLGEIREKFKKLDINAVHVYPAGAGGKIDNKTRTAIEGARFTWVFCSDSGWFEAMEGSSLLNATGNSMQSGGILVIGN